MPSGGGQAALSALRSVVRVSRERVGGVLSERWGRRGVVVVLVGAREKRKFFFYLFGVCGRGWDCGWDEVCGWSGKRGLPVQ